MTTPRRKVSARAVNVRALSTTKQRSVVNFSMFSRHWPRMLGEATTTVVSTRPRSRRSECGTRACCKCACAP